MKHSLLVLALAGIAVSGCATKTICANGSESFRPVLDPTNSCKVRIRQVVVGSDIKIPSSVAIDGGAINWSYSWTETEFKDGQITLGHIVLKPDSRLQASEKK